MSPPGLPPTQGRQNPFYFKMLSDLGISPLETAPCVHRESPLGNSFITAFKENLPAF